MEILAEKETAETQSSFDFESSGEGGHVPLARFVCAVLAKQSLLKIRA